MALECAAYIKRRALELPLNQRKGIVERLKQLISVDEKEQLILFQLNGLLLS